MKKKESNICVMYQCQNKKYKDKELCLNHWNVRDQLFSYKNRDMIKNPKILKEKKRTNSEVR